MMFMNIRSNFTIFFILLLIISQLMNMAAANGQENITGEEIGKQILANAPLGILSGSDLDKARYAYIIYCDTLAYANTSEDRELVNSLQSPDHAEFLRSIFHGMGIALNKSLELVAAKTNLSKNESIDHSQFHAAVTVAFVDRLYVFDPLMMFRVTGRYNDSDISEWNGMDVRGWGNKLMDEGYSLFKGEGGSWHYSAGEIEDQVFNRPSCFGEYRAELKPECENCSGIADHSSNFDIIKFIILPDNEVIGILEGKEESGNQLEDNLSKALVKGEIYGYYDSRTRELGFTIMIQPQEIETKSHPLFATYDEVKSGQAQLIDARTPEEYAAGAIPGAINLPYDLVQSGDSIIDDASLNAAFSDLDKNKPVIVYTSTGVKASPVCFALKVLGYDARLYTYQDWQEHIAGVTG